MKLLALAFVLGVAFAAQANAASISHSHSQPLWAPRHSPRLMDNRIVGGHEVDISRHPHQISIRFKNILYPRNSFTHWCGGSIIKHNLILTAAHCVFATVASQFQIVAGSNFRTGSDGVIVRVKEIIIHEDYDPDTTNNDIALLVTATDIPLNGFTIKAIELANEEPKEGAMATTSGWGALASGGLPPETLQAVNVPIVNHDLCNEDYFGRITDAMLCAGFRDVGGKDACQGDSGGPLLVNGKLAGIVSWGFGCGWPEFPGVYTKVSYLRPWLDEKIALVEQRENELRNK